MRRMHVRTVSALSLLLVAGCGETEISTPSSQSSEVFTTSATDPVSAPEAIVEVAGPAEFFFIVDGPLVTNGPPWDCVAAGTTCDSPSGNLRGTIELLDDCIVVQGSDSAPDSKSVVIFRFGVAWDDATQTILGLGPEPVALGDEADFLAVANAAPDAWTESLGLPKVPAEVHECMRNAGTDTIYYNIPWTQVGAAPVNTVSSETTAPLGP